MNIAEAWRVDYVRYRNPDFSGRYYAANKADAERTAEKLRLMKHVSDVRVVGPVNVPTLREGR